MSNAMTSTSSPEVEEYYGAVRDALTELPGELGHDLLEDLPDHLTEVLAEGEGTLRQRLGEPAAYAEELRAAAGLEPPAFDASSGEVRGRAADCAGRVVRIARRFDIRAGRLVGYPRLMDLLRAARPGWWVLRGWVVAQFLCGVRSRDGWDGLLPRFGGNALAGFCLTLVAIAASVWLGRRSLRFSAWPRRAMFAASVVIAVWAVTQLIPTGAAAYTYIDPASNGYPAPPYVSDVYVYDKDGKPVDGARLFDQNGNPIQLGSSGCQDGSPAPGANPDGADAAKPWTYPLCPTDIGPFRSGPGPATVTASVPATASNSPSATTRVAPTTGHGATHGAKSRPTVRPTR